MLHDLCKCAHRNCCMLQASSLQVAVDSALTKSSNLSGLVKMDRSIDKSVIQCSELAGLAEKAGESLERGKGDVWNANLTCKFNGDMNPSFGSHIINIKTGNGNAASSLFYPANEALQVPLRNGATRTFPLNSPPASQVFPTAAFGGIPLLNNVYLGSSNLSCGYGKLGALGCILKPAQLNNNLDVQLSEGCKRRFVMFDRSGSKRKMIFHPAMMNEFSALLPTSLQTTLMYNLCSISEKCCLGKDTNLVRSSFPACISPLGVSSPYYDSRLMPISAAMDPMSSASENCDTPLLADRENVGVEIEIDNLDGSLELSCFSHENTEDLEALLSSDEDEVSSTGHSPSDLTRNNSLTACPTNSEGYDMCNSKKRKREFEVNEDDTCSTATSGSKTCKDLPSQKVIGADSNSAHIQERLAFQEPALLKPMGYGSATLDMLFPDEVSSSSSANNQKWREKLPKWQQPQQQLPTEQSRKEKIKNILHLLRGIIPGGESMDTAFVLDEAIQYVRTLQSEVQKLKARKSTSRK